MLYFVCVCGVYGVVCVFVCVCMCRCARVYVYVCVHACVCAHVYACMSYTVSMLSMQTCSLTTSVQLVH